MSIWLNSRIGSLAVPLMAFASVLAVPAVAQAQDDEETEASEEEFGEDEAVDEEVADEEATDADEEDADEEDADEEDADEEEMADDPGASDISENDLEGIVVEGYRKSLDAALKTKKRSTAQVDAIVAEDMADFPDTNLAEALQRIPGVAITRSSGEGARITVRGLGARFTRTRVNGMDARASVGGNNSRSFDFNMFASELFNSIVVHKTATPELHEGSLGAVVDLNTARPFDYDEGFTFLAGAEGGYNDLSGAFFPRLTGLVGYQDPEGIWGATASVAYSKVRLDSESANTVRWQKSRFRSVLGEPCFDAAGEPLASANCDAVADAFHPRIPRYGYNELTGDRLGFTAGFQLKPTDKLDIKLDGMYAIYNRETNFRTLEVLFRGNENEVDVTNFSTVAGTNRFGMGNNTLTGLSVNNAPLRSETFRQIQENDFKQATLAIDYEFTDSLYANFLGGMMRGSSVKPHETTLMYDIPTYNGYRYDFTDDELPVLAYEGATDLTNPANFTLTELRDRPTETHNAFDVAEFHLHWDAAEELKVSLGADYKSARMNTHQKRRDGSACRPGLVNCDPNNDGMNELSGAPGNPALSDIYTYPGEVGPGSTTSWAAPNIDGWVGALGFYNLEATPTLGEIRTVQEDAFGAYLQASGEVPVGDMNLQYNGGVRYVQTHQKSSGFVNELQTKVERDPYSDILPSVNLALWFTEDLVTRLAGARAMSRPALGDLTPGASVSSFNYTASFKNTDLDPTRAWTLDAALEWYFAPESAIILAGFGKFIDSFPETKPTFGTFAETGLSRAVIVPTSPADMNIDMQPWEISRLGNGPSATILGLEVGFQMPLVAISDDMPVILRDMGVVANYTYVDSVRDYTFLSEENRFEERLGGLSNHSYNATLYYDDSVFSLRASLAARSQYLDGAAARNGNLFQFVEPSARVDMSSSYKITDNIQANLEALNLTNAPFDRQVDLDATRRESFNRLGRTYLLGLRYSM